MFLVLAAAACLHAQVKVAVSDVLGKNFATAIETNAHVAGSELNVSLLGSRTSLVRLQNGEIDLAVVIPGLGDKLPSGDFVSMVVAYQTAVVVAQETLPISQMTFEQLDLIFCETSPSTIRRWGDLGIPGMWNPRPIIPMMTGPLAGLSYDLFKNTVMSSMSVKVGVSIYDSVDATVARLNSGEDGGLAVLPLPPKNRRLKALLLMKQGQNIAQAPTPENVHSGAYPIRMPVYMVFKKSEAQRLFGLTRYFLGEEGAQTWESANMMPLPLQVRNQGIFELEDL